MRFSARATIGLDIGSRVVKAVQLRRNGKSIELEKFGLADIFPVGANIPSPQEQGPAKIKAVKQALESAGITARQSCSSVRGESIIVRYIQMPDMPLQELKNALRWEAEEYIPFRIDEVNLDYTIVGSTGEGSAKKLDVLLVCARKDLINDHLAVVRGAGLTPEIVDVDSFAFLNCFEINHQPEPSDVVALVNIGGDITGISVYTGGNPRFSRDISIGGNTITNAIHQRLEVSLAEAETIKVKCGAPRDQEKPAESPAPAGSTLMDTIRSSVESITGEKLEDKSREAMAQKVISNSLSNMTTEIRRSIQFFENQARSVKVNRLVLGGGSSSLEGLDAYFQKELNLPVETIDPLRRIPVTGKGIDARMLRENRHMLSVSIGLALRKVVD